MTTRFSSREFNQATGKAKQAARRGPVFITEREEVRFVLLSVRDYERLVRRRPTLAEALAMPGYYVEFAPPRLADLPRPAELD